MYFLATANEPTIATTSQLTGTSFMVIMVDLDIPSTTNPHTFLHWVQTDLTPSTAASAVSAASNATSATTQAFTLTNTKGTAALVPYTQPNPPAQNPLSHRYTQVLVDTSALSATALATIQAAVQSKVGFDVATVLQNAGLTANVVAGNSFNVTNAGPATSGNANAGAGAAAANGTAAASPSTATQGGGKKGQKGNKTRTGAGAAQATGADGNGNGNGKGKGSGNAQATKSGGGGGNKGNKPTSTASAGASGLPAATGATVNNNLTNSGASGRNGTGTVTTSGAMSGYGLGGLLVTPVLAALLGAVVYAL